MRNLLLLALCLGAAGCGPEVTFKNPVDGSTATCPGSALADINPWTNYHLCLQQHVSAGYQRIR